MERNRSGNRNEYRILVERYSHRVFRLCYRLTGNEEDAEEVVQEAFLKAYRQIDRYERRASFGTWLFRIASNCAYDLLRTRKRHAPPPEDAPEPESPAMQERLVWSKEMRRRFDATLNSMSEKERAAFVLRHLEGLSIPEAGEALGLSDGATKHSIFRAVRKLRQALAPFVGVAPSGV